MPVSRNSIRDDQHLVRYLLGCLTDEEAEWLDEQSLVDDGVAAELRLAEDDLVDAYVRGALGGDLLERFESVYLASPRRREKVAFAKRLLSAVDRTGAARPGDGSPVSASVTGPTAYISMRPATRVAMRRNSWVWPLIAAAAVALLSTGGLIVRERQFERALQQASRQEATADRQAQSLSGELESQRAANVSLTQELDRLRAAPPVVAVALVLPPQTRGVSRPPIVAVRPGTRAVPVALLVEDAGFSRYQVSLRDPATNRILWRSPPLASSGRPPTVPVEVPAALLKPQHYSLELSGRRSAGTPEVVGTYVFQVVPQ